MKLLLGAAAAAALLAGPAFAQIPATTTFYGNIGYTQLSSDLGDGDGLFDEDVEINTGAITGRVGARFGQYLGAEGELSFGVNESEESFSAGTVNGVPITGDLTYKLNNEIGVFGVGFLPVAPNTDLFARIGVGRIEAEVETTVSGGGFSQSDSFEGESNFFAVGAGAQYFFDGLNGVRGEYTRYQLDEDEGEDSAEFDSFSISYVRRF